MKVRNLFTLALLFFLLPVAASPEEKRFNIPLENSPSLGPENAPVTIVEFIDFQ
jgi:hypothetical protein